MVVASKEGVSLFQTNVPQKPLRSHRPHPWPFFFHKMRGSLAPHLLSRQRRGRPPCCRNKFFTLGLMRALGPAAGVSRNGACKVATPPLVDAMSVATSIRTSSSVATPPPITQASIMLAASSSTVSLPLSQLPALTPPPPLVSSPLDVSGQHVPNP